MELTKTHYIIIAAAAVIIVAGAAAAIYFNGNSGGGSDVTIDDYSDSPVLWIRGNVDGDEKITKSDTALIEKILETNGATVKNYPWADANNDGKLNSDDVTFVKNMINGKATTLYYKNIDDEIRSFTVRDHFNIISVNQCNLQEINMIINTDSKSKVVGGDQQIKKYNNVFNLNFGDDPAKGEVLVTGTSNGEVQNDVVSTLLKQYGHVEITLGSKTSYGKELETFFGSNENVSIVRLPSWEDAAESGVMTYGYLFGGVQKNSCWKQAEKWYDWYTGYMDVITAEVSKIASKDRPNVITMYVKDCYPGATNKVLSKTSGDYERSELSGGNNVGDYFGSGYVAVTAEDMAACEKSRGIDIIVVEPSGVYGDDGKEYVINAVQLCINEFDGYINPETDIYSLSFMVTTGPASVVCQVFFAKAFFPDNSAFKNFDATKAFAEFLELAGWSDRTDISDIVSYGPGHTTKPI